MSEIAERWVEVDDRVAAAAQRSGRERADVRIHAIDPMSRDFWPFPAKGLETDDADAPPLPGNEPERWVDTYVKAGADYLTLHVEACAHLDRALHMVREAGAKAGAALNPATGPGTLEYVLDDLDLVLVMSVNPGFGGQSFIPTAYEKLRRIRGMLGKRDVLLSVDGGVKAANAAALAQAGATVLVAGSSVFGAADPGAAVAALRTAAEVARSA